MWITNKLKAERHLCSGYLRTGIQKAMRQVLVMLILSCWFTATGGSGVEIFVKKGEKPAFLSTKSPWVKSTFDSMTLEQRIGQLFMVAAYSRDGLKHELQLQQLVKEHHIGGLIFFQGGPLRQAYMCNRLQAQAKVPMLIGMDAEWGLSMRLDSTIAFPRQMTLGAIKSDTLVYEMGKEIARQFKRMGMHINFAPVADVNNNPKNPVINSRSFGENRENVTNKSAAYMRGMQDAMILANAKHFPGHGDTDTDSHYALPVVNHSRERLDSLEFYPFKELFKKGLASTMIAHLYIPALDSTSKQASTLSKAIVTDLLRKEMGFEGLIITDALNMKGVSAQFKPGTAELNALLAGNDILLFAEDVPKAVALIKAAIESGEISEEQINESCLRILKAKAWVGLDDYKPIKTKGLLADLNTKKAEALRRKIIKASMTLAVNQNQIVPLKTGRKVKIASVAIGAKAGNSFQKTMQRYAPVQVNIVQSDATPADIQFIKQQTAEAEVVVISIHATSQKVGSNFGLKDGAIRLIEYLSAEKPVVLVHFGNAYAVQKMDLQNLKGLLIAYQDTDETHEAAAQALFGGKKVDGQLPVSLGEFCRAGESSNSVGGKLGFAIPEEVGLRSDILNKKIDSLAMWGIKEMAYPGCQIVVARKGQIVYSKTFGHQTYEGKVPVKESDLYDLASVTKILASTVSIMRLQDEGKFSLDKTLGDYLPIDKDSPYYKLPMRKVLAHQAGLIPWIPFYTKTLEKGEPKPEYYSKVQSEKYPIRVAEDLYITKRDSDSLLTRILGTKLRSEAEMKESEYIYSDLGYYFIREIVKNLSGLPLDEYVNQSFYEPMGLLTLGYKPRENFPLSRIIPTEYETTFRKQLIHGDVHDQGAAMLGGVGGHAGLFSNALDVAAMMQMLIDGGVYNNIQLLKPETIKEYTKCQYCISETDKTRRGAGFDKPVMGPGPGPTCKCVSFETFGHTGFTGTMAWADPEHELVYVFLSNRVYPTAENKKLINLNIRSKIQEAIYSAIYE
jgi:beta-N-acetylhexosaminidase